ncbi:g9605 [Coccomyxa viridis]|uniref:Endoglucanase n=1 Tax=Coccomyxa viridis TaxID=1274662 RepID=A0ABP1G3P8_9CHLO
MGCRRFVQTGTVVCVAVLSLVSRHGSVSAQSRAPSRSLTATSTAAPSSAPGIGTFEPSLGDYAAKHQSINTAFKLNSTFFANLSATVVPALQKVSNGTFDIKPIAQAGGSKIESASDEYDYGQVLGLSWKFYEAQRSGKLPANNSIPWRGDSALGDKAPDGSDVTGGWYDAGDHLKLNFPMAWAASVLAWGFIEFQDGYSSSAQTAYAADGLRWVADYFIKCHHSDVAYTAQVGDPGSDHATWGRAEDMTMARPSWDLDQNNPGSDLLGQTAAALAAISIMFEKSDPNYALMLEAHARDLYAIGTTFQGKYSDSIKAAYPYPSSNFLDDLTWGAAWMYRKTGEQQFLDDALNFWERNKDEEGGGGYLAWNWDSSIWGADVLLAQLMPHPDPKYGSEVQRFLEAWITGTDGITYTPGGLAWGNQWGTLRFVTNAAMIASVYANNVQSTDPTMSHRYSCWARSQMKYILGDSGRSYVVGFGNDPPTHAHHRGASCPPETGGLGSNVPTCDYSDFSVATADPNIIYGALLGGPAQDDSYMDSRSNYQQNEPAVDYNSGFTGVLAYLTGSPDSWDQCVARGDVVHTPQKASNNGS